ncbi:MAG: lysophospholipid acyltransferase family protein [Ginsengibacter sp.]
MTFPGKVLKFFFSIYGFTVFIVWMFILLPIFIYAFLEEPVKGGNLIYKVSRFWADAFFFMIGIDHRNIYEQPYDNNEEYIFISNHISYLDIPMMMKVIRRKNIRILGKAEMNKIPIFGSIYKRGAVSVDRRNVIARAKSLNKLIAFINKNISVFICPEGTFNTTNQALKNFYNGAFRIAIESKKPIQPILFLDTYDRLSYKSIFSLNPGKCRAVFLSKTSTENLTIEDVSFLKEKIYDQMKEALIRYEASWIQKN